ncbi:nuclear transport factor 2 family protein [Pendulispora albinea]|uniref:Nuclear transport factor 2 family protein n=1 Tax=Pendulispora albinea TaxID=2741071 RepID=A0ABZ2LR87_9BACT
MKRDTAASPGPSHPLSVLERFFAAEVAYMVAGGVGNASFEGMAACLDPEVELHQAEGLPYRGTWRGHLGMERFFAAFTETWQSFEILRQDFLVDGDRVVVDNRIRARARATGKELEFPILQIVTMKGDRIVEVRPFYWDTAAIAEACSPPR